MEMFAETPSACFSVPTETPRKGLDKMGGRKAEEAVAGQSCRGPGDGRQAGWEVMPRDCWGRVWDYTNAECVEG